jgi:Uma2 family endonuclease
MLMSTVLPVEPPLPGPPPFPIARFSVEQYHRMIESGAFTEDDRVELIEGWVVRKMAKGPAHEYSTGECEELLRERLPAGWHVRNQAPITLSNSEPEPDLAVARGTRADFRSRHPRGGDLALIVEISDTTFDTDRLKGVTYGAAGIRVYWLVNLRERCVEVYTQPTGIGATGYAGCEVLAEGEELRLVIDDEDCGGIAVTSLLP